MIMTRSRGGRVAPHKFGLGSLLGALPMASKTSLVHIIMPFTEDCTQPPLDDPNYRVQFHPRRLIRQTPGGNGAAEHAATASDEKTYDIRGIR